jgi:molybdopterin-guanine dinucleotide biosynthesis protein A
VQNKAICTGVILAGGQSRRMGGGDKCLLSIGEKSILQHTIDRASCQVNKLLLNCNGDEARFNVTRMPIVKDFYEGWRGPLAGIHAALSWMTTHQPDSQWLVSFAADTPFFPKNLVEELLLQVKGNHYEVIVASHNDEMQPLFALWNKSILSKLEEHLQNDGSPKMQTWIKLQKHITVEFKTSSIGPINNYSIDPFFNINTQLEYKAVLAMLSVNN